jgi:hypothetical protein
MVLWGFSLGSTHRVVGFTSGFAGFPVVLWGLPGFYKGFYMSHRCYQGLYMSPFLSIGLGPVLAFTWCVGALGEYCGKPYCGNSWRDLPDIGSISV